MGHRQFVMNVWDFRRHVTLHRRRVLKLGWQLRSMTKSPLVLFLVLLVHDLEKYLFLPWLWAYYGGKGWRTGARRLYTRMNKFGQFIQDAVLLPFFWNKEAIADAVRIEHIADVVDRNTDPVAMEEFCLKVQRPMSDFLPAEDLYIAETLKKLWPDVTSHLQYRR